MKTSNDFIRRGIITIAVLVAGSLLFLSSCKTNQSLPVLTTDDVTAITSTTAVSGGNITSDGGAAVESRGISWNTAGLPNRSDNTVTAGTGTGTFTGDITNLAPNTLYHVRAFATNAVGTGYGNEVTFTTLTGSMPVLTTTVVSMLTSTTAMSGGDITSDGGQAIIQRGVCWSTTQNPSINDSKTTDGPGTGIFESNLANLTPATTYYLRAYATNSAGTAYGNELTFTTHVAQGANEVFIQGMAFSPSTITVAANTTVTWTNKDGVDHTVTSDGGLFDSGTIGTNVTFSHLFTTPGSYPYHCSIHTYMLGTVVVN